MLYGGIILGLLDWITDIIYYNKIQFANDSLKNACIVFIVFQPLWYVFLYAVYIASHSEIETHRERIIKFFIAPLYGLL